jgi:DNA-directed RNA polymerase specialized sigma24 family protein
VSKRDDRWNLTPRALDRLLDRLSPDRGKAAAEYEAVRGRLIDFFAWRGCPDPESFADETLDRVARKLREGEPVENVHRYALGVGRLMLLESVRRHQRQTRVHKEWRPEPPPTPPDEQHLRCLERCMQQLSTVQRSLLSQYYQEGEGRAMLEARKVLAAQLGISPGALKVRVHRARAAVETCVRRCVDRKGR